MTRQRSVRESDDSLLRKVAATHAAPVFVAVPAHAGRYVVGGRLGSGGLGTVHAGWDPDLNRSVAIKFVRPDRTGGSSGTHLQARLRYEARALARLEHPHVVKVFDVGEVDGQVYIAMERLSGNTVRDWLANTRPSTREVVSVFEEAGQGLAAAHAVGVVHRDFKPDNVLIENGRACVIDFGLAGAPDTYPSTSSVPIETAQQMPLTETGAVLGTRGYAAPEQAAGERATEASDQYSFCVSLSEALTGAPPETCVADPSLIRDRLPARAAAAVVRGLDPDPRRRHSSMLSLLVELRGRSGRRMAWLVAVVVAAIATAIVAWPSPPRTGACGSPGAAPCPEGSDTLPPPPAAFASDAAAVREQIVEARRHREVGNVDQALELASDALRRAKRLQYAPVVVEAQLELGRVESVVGSREESGKLVQAAYFEAQRIGYDRLAFLAALKLADNELKEARLGDARRWLDHAEGILPRVKPGEAEARLRTGRGDLALRQGEADAAFAQYREALDILETHEIEGRPVAVAHIGAAQAAQFQDRADAAREHFTLGVEVLEHNEEGGGPGLAYALFAFARFEFEIGRFDPALALVERAIQIDTKAFGPDALAVATSRILLGETLRRLGRLDDAQAEFEHALRSFELLDPRHADLAAVLESLARIHLAKGATALAVDAYAHALVVREATIGRQHEVTAYALLGLSSARAEAGDLNIALEHAREAQTILEATRGPDAAETAAAVATQAEIHLALGDMGAARETASRAEAVLAATERFPHVLALARFFLAQALWPDAKQRIRSRALAQEAAVFFDGAGPSYAAERLAAHEWLDEHKG